MKTQHQTQAVILLSGGMDSCVCAAQAVHDFSGEAVAALHMSYGQRTEQREAQSFFAVSEKLGIGQRMALRNEVLPAIGGSALTDGSIAVPESGEIGLGIPATYVPFRNAHFLAAAVSWAEVLGARRIFIGAVEQDSSGYPDCRPEYYRAFNEVIRLGVKPETHIEICAPLIHMKKADIIRFGLELGAPLSLTWSCYQSSEAACSVCDSCALRLRAFAQAGVPDAIPYRRT